jgi:hypothetical protein
MTYKLLATRYDTARTTWLETFDELANVGVRWALPGGLQRMELTVKARSKLDAYERYRTHLGDGFALFDSWNLTRPLVDGWGYEVVPDERHVHYIIAGPWKRLTDEYEDDNPDRTTPPATDAYLKAALTAHAPAVSSDQGNIISTSINMPEGWEVDPDTGTVLQDIVKDIQAMGTSTTGQIIDFFFRSARVNGFQLQAPIPYLGARSTSVGHWWQVEQKDLRDITYGRNIWDLANDVQIWYTLTTLQNGAGAEDAASIEVDSISGFAAGDTIEIELDNSKVHRTEINGAPAGTTITLNDPLPHTSPDDGVVKRVKPLTATTAVTDATSQADYWTRHFRERRSEMNQTAADAYAETIEAEFDNPVHLASFTIGSRFVRENGQRWPLPVMLTFPDNILISDLYPAEATFTDSGDQLRIMKIAALDFDYSTWTMRVVPDAFWGDNRLDVLLQQAGLNVGQIVQRGI